MNAPAVAENLIEASFDVVAVVTQPGRRGMTDEDGTLIRLVRGIAHITHHHSSSLTITHHHSSQ
jgi:hypothetical protein